MDRRRKDNDGKVKVAIIDSGLDTSHPDFLSYNFGAHNTQDWTGTSATHDAVGHGTHAAGLIHRVAPRAELYIAKAFNSSDGDACTPHRVAKVSTIPKFPLYPGSRDKQAIRHASLPQPQGWGVNIITMSFAFSRRDEDVVEAVREAHKQGVIMFAAASNYGAIEGKTTAFPANIVGQVIKISSTDGWGSKSRWNPDKSKNDDNFSVLGEAVSSAWPAHLNQGTEQRKSGTSIATPVAAGIAALVLEFATQKPQTISHRDILWRYEGMRAIFAKMATPKDGFSWVVPWNLFNEEWKTADISNRITYELQECGL